MTLEELAAHAEIKQVLYRYCRGVDRGDAAMIAACYTPDAVDYHGSWQGKGRDFGDYLVPSMDAASIVGQHNITNVLIELVGSEAAVESYFFAFHPDAATNTHTYVAGRYLDRFRLHEGQWLIAERHVVIDFTRPLAKAEPWAGQAHFPAGARREKDPSAALFAGLGA